MKTKPHGKGMTHKQIIDFSNRIAYSGYNANRNNSFSQGWGAACKYFAHEIRRLLRYYESINEQ